MAGLSPPYETPPFSLRSGQKVPGEPASVPDTGADEEPSAVYPQAPKHPRPVRRSPALGTLSPLRGARANARVAFPQNNSCTSSRTFSLSQS